MENANWFYVHPLQVCEESSLSGALGNGPTNEFRPAVNPVQLKVHPVSLISKIKPHKPGKGSRRPIRFIINPNEQNPGPDNHVDRVDAVRFRSDDDLIPGVALFEALCGDGLLSGQGAVLDRVIVTDQNGSFQPFGQEILNFVMLWPAPVNYSWKQTIMLNDPIGRKRITVQHLLLAVTYQFSQLFQRSGEPKKGMPFGDNREYIKFEQLRLLQIYSKDNGITWYPELGVCAANHP